MSWRFGSGGRSWLLRAEQTFCLFLVIKSILYIILQSNYTKLQQHASSVSEVANVANVNQMKRLRHIMSWVGFSYREMGWAAVLGYSLLVAFLVVFFFIEQITGGHSSRLYERDAFVQTNMDAESANLRLKVTLDCCIKEALRPVSHSLATMIGKNPKIHHRARQMKSNYRLRQLIEQQTYLRYFQTNEGRIWPENRATDWLKEQRSFALRLYTLIYTGFGIGGILANIITQRISFQRLEQKGETPLKLMERSAFCEQLVLIGYTIDSFAIPVVLFVTIFRDKTMYLQILKGRFLRLEKSLQYLATLQQLSAHDQLDEKLKGILEKARSDCSKEALDLYLRIRMFTIELKPSIELTSMIMNQFFFFIFGTLALSLPSYSFEFDSIIIKVVAAFVVQFICAINLACIVCANFNAACIRTYLLAWKLVALSTLQRARNSSETNFNEYSISDRVVDNSLPGECQLIDDRELNGFYLINGYTMILWRRLALNQDAIETSCRIMLGVKLDYSGILRVNFWFISIVLIFFTQSHT